MNKFAAAGNFGVGLTNSTIWASRSWLNEFKVVADGTTGVWGGKKPIDVTSVSMGTAVSPRSTVDIVVDFVLPKSSSTADSNYVAVQLPFQWGGVAKWMDGTAAPAMSLQLGTKSTTTPVKTTYKTVKGTTGMVSGCHAVFTLDAAATKMAEEGIYRLTIGGVATAENGASAAQMNLGSLVISVGKTTAGGLGYSSAQLFNSLVA